MMVQRQSDAAVAQFRDDRQGIFQAVMGKAVGVVTEEQWENSLNAACGLALANHRAAPSRKRQSLRGARRQERREFRFFRHPGVAGVQDGHGETIRDRARRAGTARTGRR